MPWSGFVIAAVFAVICLTLLSLASDFLVDWLWFSSIGYLQVFLTAIGAKAIVFFAVLAATTVVLWLNGVLAARFAMQQPLQIPAAPWKVVGVAPPPDPFVILRDRLTRPRFIALGAGLLALLVAAGEAGNWSIFLQFLYHVPYGAEDPLYNKDIGFYLFSLPAYIAIKNWMLLAIVLSALFAGAIYWARGDIEYDVHNRSISPTVIAHGSALVGLLFAVKAWSYGLDRYLLLYGDNGVVVGASYTDVHLGLPALWLMIGLSIIAAFIAWANLRARNWRLLAASFILVGAGSVVLSSLVPSLFRHFVVKPTELQLEKPYIERNIALTRQAYNLDRDRGQAVCRRTEADLQDAGGQQGDHRQYPAMGLAAAVGYLRAAAGDPHLLQIPRS